MKERMKNNKGITLTSIVIYIAVMFVVLAIIMRITTYFSNNISDVADVTFETQVEKLNLYFIDEANRAGNEIELISENGNEITFTSGNRYTYNAEEKTIYLNDTINICENIDACQFSKDTETATNKKAIIKVQIQIEEKNKLLQYVMTTEEQQGELLNEEDYILNIVEESSNVITE